VQLLRLLVTSKSPRHEERILALGKPVCDVKPKSPPNQPMVGRGTLGCFLYSNSLPGPPARFVVEFDPATEAVSYLIEAVSRPRHPLARLAYPFSRAMQHRFAKDSHERLAHYVAPYS